MFSLGFRKIKNTKRWQGGKALTGNEPINHKLLNLLLTGQLPIFIHALSLSLSLSLSYDYYLGAVTNTLSTLPHTKILVSTHLQLNHNVLSLCIEITLAVEVVQQVVFESCELATALDESN